MKPVHMVSENSANSADWRAILPLDSKDPENSIISMVTTIDSINRSVMTERRQRVIGSALPLLLIVID